MQRANALGEAASNVMHLVHTPQLQRCHSSSSYRRLSCLSQNRAHILAARNPVTWNRPIYTRQMSWLKKFTGFGRGAESFSPISDGHDEAARSAILEKVMKGRQPTDLMLRCSYSLVYSSTCSPSNLCRQVPSSILKVYPIVFPTPLSLKFIIQAM